MPSGQQASDASQTPNLRRRCSPRKPEDTFIAWGDELLSIDWAWCGGDDGAYAGRYLTQFVDCGCDAMVSNAHGTEVGVAMLGGDIPIPLTRPLPCTSRARLRRGAYTSSAYSHFVHMGADEVLFHAPRLADRYQRPIVVWHSSAALSLQHC